MAREVGRGSPCHQAFRVGQVPQVSRVPAAQPIIIKDANLRPLCFTSVFLIFRVGSGLYL